jgi:hypothetical protein
VLFVALAILGIVDDSRAGATDAGGIDAMNLDADTMGNTATAISTVETCVAIAQGGIATLDITALGIPNLYPQPTTPVAPFGRMIGFAYTLNYPFAGVTALQVDTVNSGAFKIATAAGSASTDYSDAVPDTDGTFNSSALDTGPIPGSAEFGDGVLSRITVTDTGGAAGLRTVFIDSNAHIDTGGGSYVPDGGSTSILLAVGVPCPPPAAVTCFIMGGPCPPPAAAPCSGICIDVETHDNTATSIGLADSCAAMVNDGIMNADDDLPPENCTTVNCSPAAF